MEYSSSSVISFFAHFSQSPHNIRNLIGRRGSTVSCRSQGGRTSPQGYLSHPPAAQGEEASKLQSMFPQLLFFQLFLTDNIIVDLSLHILYHIDPFPSPIHPSICLSVFRVPVMAVFNLLAFDPRASMCMP